MVLNLLSLTSCSCTVTTILSSFPLLTFFLPKFTGCLSCQKLWKRIQDTFTSTGLQQPKYFLLTSTLWDYGRLSTHKVPSLSLCSGRDIRILCLRKAWLSASHEKKRLKRRIKYVATSNSEAAAVKKNKKLMNWIEDHIKRRAFCHRAGWRFSADVSWYWWNGNRGL